ncbi:hypothetical protein GUF90_19895 [Xanthomonas citri pv. citri]|nr:hypothetical protein [Xanthomonas citri pv. citri]
MRSPRVREIEERTQGCPAGTIDSPVCEYRTSPHAEAHQATRCSLSSAVRCFGGLGKGPIVRRGSGFFLAARVRKSAVHNVIKPKPIGLARRDNARRFNGLLERSITEDAAMQRQTENTCRTQHISPEGQPNVAGEVVVFHRLEVVTDLDGE